MTVGLAVGADDKSAWLFDLEDENQTIELRGHADQIESIAILQDDSDQLRVLTASRDKSARVWDPRLGHSPEELNMSRQGREVLSLRKHSQGLTAVECTRDGSLVITAARDGRLLLWPSE